MRGLLLTIAYIFLLPFCLVGFCFVAIAYYVYLVIELFKKMIQTIKDKDLPEENN